MFTTFLKELAGYFDRYWLRSAFFPMLAFCLACLLLYAGGTGLGAALERWKGLSSDQQVLLPLVGLSCVAVFAYFLGSIHTNVTRLFEGYWQSVPLVWLRNCRMRHYQSRSQHLQNRILELNKRIDSLNSRPAFRESESTLTALNLNAELLGKEREWHVFFPEDDGRIMPTRLGNIIRAGELYPWKRYGIDAVVIWPRLQGLLPNNSLETLRAAKGDMDLWLSLAALGFIFGITACPALALLTRHGVLFLLCWASFPFAWLCYRSALSSAQLYSELIKTAFDLHRWSLLEALHLTIPTSYEEEVRIWEDLTYLIYRGIPPVYAKYEGYQGEQKQEGAFKSVSQLTNSIQRILSGSTNKTESPKTRVESPPQAQQRSIHEPSGSASPTTLGRVAGSSGFWYFLSVSLICLIGLSVIQQKEIPKVSVPALKRDLPVYHRITSDDYGYQSLEQAAVPADALRTDDEVPNHYTLQAMSSGSVIRRPQVQNVENPDRLLGTVTMAIPATSAMTLGGNLRAGDSIDVALAVDAAKPIGECTLENIIVLDVRATLGEVEKAESPFIIVLALPQNCSQTFANKAELGKLIITRR